VEEGGGRFAEERGGRCVEKRGGEGWWWERREVSGGER
jgi:hypothetical protein